MSTPPEPSPRSSASTFTTTSSPTSERPTSATSATAARRAPSPPSVASSTTSRCSRSSFAERAPAAAGARSANDEREQRLVVELATEGGEGARRAAVADVALVGRSEVGDEVVVNVEALDLGLGSGGFDIVHVNLTRGLDGGGTPGAEVMKLNYTSLQHAVAPIEDELLELPVERPVAVLALHGQLAAVAWAFAQSAPGGRLGYVQTEGGALPGALWANAHA